MNTLRIALPLVLASACAVRATLPPPALPLTPSAHGLEHSAPLAGPTPTSEVQLPRVQAARLDNGLMVYVVERHALPHVAVAYVSRRGGEDPADLELSGLASVVQEMLLGSGGERCAAGKSADSGKQSARSASQASTQPSAQEGEPTSLSFAGAVLRHVSYVSTHVESHELDLALSCLADMVREPDLSAQALVRARKRATWAWDDERYHVHGVAVNHLMQRIYGPSHVLGQHADMAVKRVDAHPLERVQAGYRERHVPVSSALVLVGDVTLAQAVQGARGEFGMWVSESPPPVGYAPSDWQPRGKRKVFLHNRTPRTEIVVGQRAPAPGSGDYVATELLAHLLGGSMGSRLMRTLRASENLTYHASAQLAPRRDGSTLVIGTAVPGDDAERALELVLHEMSRLMTEPVSEPELERGAHGSRARALRDQRLRTWRHHRRARARGRPHSRGGRPARGAARHHAPGTKGRGRTRAHAAQCARHRGGRSQLGQRSQSVGRGRRRDVRVGVSHRAPRSL
jgi:zinc protease